MTAIKSSKLAGKLRMVSFLALALTGIMFMGLNANTASAQTPGFLEGGIENVDLDARTVTINGVLAHVPLSTPITSATGTSLTLDQISLAVGGTLPGRPTGFEGGTCLCTVDIDALGNVTVTDFFAEPSENGIVATVTEHSCSTSDCSGPGDVFNVGGTPMGINTDPRIHSPAPTNSGFEVNLQNVIGGVEDPALSLVGQLADAVGYFADGQLYYYAMDVAGAPPLSSDAEIAITRARCRNRNGGAQYRIEGTTTNPGGASHGGPVDLIVNGTTIMGTSTQDPADPTAAFATWAIRDTIAGSCESGIAIYTPDGGTPVQTTFDPDIR